MRDEKYIVEEVDTAKSAIEIFEAFKERPYSAILDSSLNDGCFGRHSIIVSDPFLVFKSKGMDIEVICGGTRETLRGDPLGHLRMLLHRCRLPYDPDLPFISGCVGYFSYDLCGMLEKLPNNPPDDTDLPDIVLGFYNHAIVMDHQKNKVFAAVSSVGLPYSGDLEQRLLEIKSAICGHGGGAQPKKDTVTAGGAVPVSNFTLEGYCGMVEKAREYIRNGDIFQVNVSQRFQAKITGHPFEIYKRLRNASPAPFSAYMSFDDARVLSSSPERFIKIGGRYIETRPIKGTRPRGRDADEDRRLRAELLNSEKDRAELTMIVDLERNDLGRVCKTGSVEVKKLFEIEEYATVFHLVSTVSGELKEGMDVIDCIRAAFPGGSITGAPKIRAMEIIDELEPVKRGIYTGSLGYIGFDGRCDLNIAIRTIVVKGDRAFFHVGGGIVWDSVPEKEYRETLDKGRALMKVLSEGGQGYAGTV